MNLPTMLKNSSLLLVFILSVIPVASAQTIRLSEPVSSTDSFETFGQAHDASLPTLTMKQLASQSEEHLGEAFQTKTRIAKVCQKKGCFFIAQDKEHILRVSFRDYGFFIPTDSSGKVVTLSGELLKKTLSPEQAEHFKKDLKADTSSSNTSSKDFDARASLKAGVVYEIIADSITIPVS